MYLCSTRYCHAGVASGRGRPMQVLSPCSPHCQRAAAPIGGRAAAGRVAGCGRAATVTGPTSPLPLDVACALDTASSISMARREVPSIMFFADLLQKLKCSVIPVRYDTVPGTRSTRVRFHVVVINEFVPTTATSTFRCWPWPRPRRSSTFSPVSVPFDADFHCAASIACARSE